MLHHSQHCKTLPSLNLGETMFYIGPWCVMFYVLVCCVLCLGVLCFKSWCVVCYVVIIDAPSCVRNFTQTWIKHFLLYQVATQTWFLNSKSYLYFSIFFVLVQIIMIFLLQKIISQLTFFDTAFIAIREHFIGPPSYGGSYKITDICPSVSLSVRPLVWCFSKKWFDSFLARW